MPEAPVTGADTAALNEIEAVVRTYLDGLYEGDVEKLAFAFHPVSDLRHVDGNGEVKVLTRKPLAYGFDLRPSAFNESNHSSSDRWIEVWYWYP